MNCEMLWLIILLLNSRIEEEEEMSMKNNSLFRLFWAAHTPPSSSLNQVFCHFTISWNWCVLYNEYFEINFKKAMVYYGCILKYYSPILYEESFTSTLSKVWGYQFGKKFGAVLKIFFNKKWHFRKWTCLWKPLHKKTQSPLNSSALSVRTQKLPARYVL